VSESPSPPRPRARPRNRWPWVAAFIIVSLAFYYRFFKYEPPVEMPCEFCTRPSVVFDLDAAPPQAWCYVHALSRSADGPFGCEICGRPISAHFIAPDTGETHYLCASHRNEYCRNHPCPDTSPVTDAPPTSPGESK
jgi:hypothetical protein